MLGLWRFRDSSPKVIGLIVFGLVFWRLGRWAIWWSMDQGGGPLDPEAPEVLQDIENAVVETTIPTIRLDGGVPDNSLLGPASAAIAFGGVVLLVGGLGAVVLWRRAESAPED
jgi:hypothetical protein